MPYIVILGETVGSKEGDLFYQTWLETRRAVARLSKWGVHFSQLWTFLRVNPTHFLEFYIQNMSTYIFWNFTHKYKVHFMECRKTIFFFVTKNTFQNWTYKKVHILEFNAQKGPHFAIPHSKKVHILEFHAQKSSTFWNSTQKKGPHFGIPWTKGSIFWSSTHKKGSHLGISHTKRSTFYA